MLLFHSVCFSNRFVFISVFFIALRIIENHCSHAEDELSLISKSLSFSVLWIYPIVSPLWILLWPCPSAAFDQAKDNGFLAWGPGQFLTFFFRCRSLILHVDFHIFLLPSGSPIWQTKHNSDSWSTFFICKVPYFLRARHLQCFGRLTSSSGATVNNMSFIVHWCWKGDKTKQWSLFYGNIFCMKICTWKNKTKTDISVHSLLSDYSTCALIGELCWEKHSVLFVFLW